MSMRFYTNRSLLHTAQIDQFSSWAQAHGCRVEQVKGDYECLRLRDSKGIMIFFKKLSANSGGDLQHITIPSRAVALVRRFIADHRMVRQ